MRENRSPVLSSPLVADHSFVVRVGWIVRDGLVLSAARLGTAAGAFITAWIFARLGTAELFGQFQYVRAVLGALAVVTLPGLNVAIAQAAARGHLGTLLPAARRRFRAALAGSVLLVVLAAVFLFRGQSGVASSLLVAAPLFPIASVSDAYLAQLSGQMAFQVLSFAQLAAALGPTVSVALALLAGLPLPWIVAAALLGATLPHIAFFLATVQRIPPTAKSDDSSLVYGFRVSGVYAIGILHAHAASLVVGTFLDHVNLAIFTVALIWGELLKQGMALANAQLFPRLAALPPHDALRLFRRATTAGLGVVAGVGGGVILAIPMVTGYLFPPTYRESVPYAQILVAGMVVAFIGNQVNTYFSARSRALPQYALGLSTFLVEVVSLAALVHSHGLLGAVLARTIGRVWHSLYGWWLVRREGA